MSEKLDPYDILSSLILGILLVCWVPLCFPLLLALKGPAYPAAFGVLALTAVSLFAGQLVQAVASLVEPALYRTFGGRPSDRAFSRGLGDRYLSAQDAARIRGRLAADRPGAADASLFRRAMQLANAAPASRTERFNALYGYHRGLLLVVLADLVLFAASSFSKAAPWPKGVFWPVVVAGLLLLALVWHRTKQRAYYYVAEVVHTADRVITGEAPAPAMPAPALADRPADDAEHGRRGQDPAAGS